MLLPLAAACGSGADAAIGADDPASLASGACDLAEVARDDAEDAAAGFEGELHTPLHVHAESLDDRAVAAGVLEAKYRVEGLLQSDDDLDGDTLGEALTLLAGELDPEAPCSG